MTRNKPVLLFIYVCNLFNLLSYDDDLNYYAQLGPLAIPLGITITRTLLWVAGDPRKYDDLVHE